MPTPSRRFPRLLAVLVACVALVAACSESSPQTPEQGSGRFPVTVTAGNGDVVINARPARIVSLSPTATESLFALGADAQVVAVDDQSDFPQQAPKTELSGFTPNIEAIAGRNPDLVVVSNDLNGVVDGLERLNIPVLLQPAAKTLDDVYSQIEALGRATGRTAEADALVRDMRSDIDRSITEAQPRSKGARIYHEVDPTLYTATSQTFAGQIYARMGLQNVADAADPQGSGFPQLSPEYLISANPAMIFLADTECCGQSAATVGARPGWQNIAAVRKNAVIPLNDDVASRWGPRTAEHVAAVADAVQRHAA